MLWVKIFVVVEFPNQAGKIVQIAFCLQLLLQKKNVFVLGKNKLFISKVLLSFSRSDQFKV